MSPVFKHEFVEFMPAKLAPGTIYISIRFATASHLCACGCGNRVVTPIRPTDWKLIFDGKTVSLEPSIGNWSFPCQSHYWVRNNCVEWAPKWSEAQIAKNRHADRWAKDAVYGAPEMRDDVSTESAAVPSNQAISKQGWWQRLAGRWRS